MGVCISWFGGGAGLQRLFGPAGISKELILAQTISGSPKDHEHHKDNEDHDDHDDYGDHEDHKDYEDLDDLDDLDDHDDSL